MSWFPFRSQRKDREPAGRPGAATQTEAEPEVHRSLALPSLFDAMGRRPKLNILDLGSAVGSNVEYLSQFGCKLSIEDLYASRSSAAEGGGGGGAAAPTSSRSSWRCPRGRCTTSSSRGTCTTISAARS